LNQNQIIKCKFCGWQCPRWRTTDGKSKQNFNRLKDHVIFYHPKEYEAIEDFIKEIDTEFSAYNYVG
jgi:hypothetical protein